MSASCGPVHSLEPLEPRRLLSVGQPVSTFGSRGVVAETAFRQVNGAMLVLNDGKVLIAGDRVADQNGSGQLFLARYLPNGTPDPSFGTGGTIQYPNSQ